ncbi:MAG: glutathione reductase [Gammaproteobacteria bacterium BRH_c0]|nr:MAG: glutathione reductase [Gammaproteobacteria bacterium BRH_c0]
MASDRYDYDLFVIGAGSGGVRAARMAAGQGVKVAIAEERYLGGTCVNVGCVPKKLFVYASEFSHAFRDAAGFGWTLPEASFHWPTLRDNKTKEIERLNGIYANLLDNAGVTRMEGTATIAGPNRVRMGDAEYSARHILLATGGWPFIPDFPGREHAISSNEVFYLDSFPRRVLVVGGGYIAVEFAGIFQGLGAETHVSYRGPLFLKEFDQDLRTGLARQMGEQGVKLHFETNVQAINKNADGSLDVSLSDGQQLKVDCVMYATGRNAKTTGLGLENTAVELAENGAIVVDEQFRTAEPSIYALGDVIDRVQLTPVAIAEAMVLVANLYNGSDESMDYDTIPTAVFSQPTIGTVGLTEAQAREQFADVAIYRTEFRPMKQTLAGGSDKILMKLVVDKASDRVLGCHMLGEAAGEIIQGLGIALKAGATKRDFDRTVGIHPTAAEEFVTMRTPI